MTFPFDGHPENLVPQTYFGSHQARGLGGGVSGFVQTTPLDPESPVWLAGDPPAVVPDRTFNFKKCFINTFHAFVFQSRLTSTAVVRYTGQ